MMAMVVLLLILLLGFGIIMPWGRRPFRPWRRRYPPRRFLPPRRRRRW